MSPSRESYLDVMRILMSNLREYRQKQMLLEAAVQDQFREEATFISIWKLLGHDFAFFLGLFSRLSIRL